MRKFIDAVSNITEDKTRDGADIEIRYVENAQSPRPAWRCDGVTAFIDGQQVGYLKFDYTTAEILKELPHLWSYAKQFSGIYFDDELDKPYVEMSAQELSSLLRAIGRYGFMRGDYPKLKDEAAELFKQYNFREGSFPRTVVETDRKTLQQILLACEKTEFGKKYQKQRASYLDHHSKPFVAYANTEQSVNNGNAGDNQRRGIGNVMYRAASQWIAERGIANGLYASSLQSSSSEGIWNLFTRMGWVTQDGDRRYLDPEKFPHVD